MQRTRGRQRLKETSGDRLFICLSLCLSVCPVIWVQRTGWWFLAVSWRFSDSFLMVSGARQVKRGQRRCLRAPPEAKSVAQNRQKTARTDARNKVVVTGGFLAVFWRF